RAPPRDPRRDRERARDGAERPELATPRFVRRLRPARARLRPERRLRAPFRGARRPAGEAPDPSRPAIVDTMGELERVYALADVAFVGGTFTDRGGQNVLEPA